MKNDLPVKVLEFLGGEMSEVTRRDLKMRRGGLDTQAISETMIKMAYEIIPEYYSQKGLVLPMASNGLGILFLEPLRNCAFRSDYVGPLPISVTLPLTPFSFVTGYCDEGSYFKREDVKKCWEAREHHPEKQGKHSVIGGSGNGTGMIYEMTDFIYVENTTGTLYNGWRKGGKYF